MSKKHKVFDEVNVVEMMSEVNNEICLDAEENNSKEFEKVKKMLDDSFVLNKSKRKSLYGESSHSAVLSNMMNAEVAKKVALMTANQNPLSAQIIDAYKQNKKIKQYLESDDIFMFASEFEREVNAIVDKLFVGDEKFKQIVSRCLNYAQFANIYAFDTELENLVKLKKRHTDFERAVYDASPRDAIMAVEPLVGIGQSAYVSLFGGRTVCAGIASTTATIMDLAFQKCGINAQAYMSSNDSHAFVEIEKDDKHYVVDPTNYYGTFKEIVRDESTLAKELGKNVKTFDLKKIDEKEHFAVVNYFIDKFNLQEKMNKIINFDDAVPIKLVKIMSFMQKHLSKMSQLIYPKAVILDGFEINVQFCFEMCLNCALIPYKTGNANYEFVIKDLNRKYIIDTYRAFDAHNQVNDAKKFLFVKQPTENNRDL